MQVSSVKGVSFNGITPQDIENRAAIIDSDQKLKEEIDAKINPELFADILDGKLKKSERGRKVVNFLASSAAFAATAVSFKKVIPKLRGAIGNRVSKIATSASQKAASKGKTTIAAIGNEVAENGKKIANEGSNLLKRTLNKTLGDAKGQNVSDALGKVGIKNEMDVVDTAAALGIATFTSREAGDIVDEEHKERSLKDAVRDIAKIAGSMGGEVTEFAEII